MIFKQFTEIATGEKVQTRRLVKPGEQWTMPLGQVVIGKDHGRVIETVKSGVTGSIKNVYAVYANRRLKWRIGNTYPVIPKIYHPTIIYHPDHPCYGVDIIQPGSGEYSDAREGDWDYEGQGYRKLYIRITGIRQEKLQDITEEDAIREGILADYPTPDTHISLYRTTYKFRTLDLYSVGYGSAVDAYHALWDSINTKKGTRWIDNPNVWVLDFERVK